jgi:hypothetical protein
LKNDKRKKKEKEVKEIISKKERNHAKNKKNQHRVQAPSTPVCPMGWCCSTVPLQMPHLRPGHYSRHTRLVLLAATR